MSYKDTAVLLIDPYNDYIHPSGKVYSLCKDSLEATSTISHLQTLVKAARLNNIPIFYCLHQPWKPGNFNNWNRMGLFYHMLKDKQVVKKGRGGRGYMRGLARI
jgi:nicotinamidase-related amidase